MIGRGEWRSAGGVKRLAPGDDIALRGLDLWRLKINKGGRVLFEVAVEYSEEQRCWCECIRLWCITLSHKKYEEAITYVQASYKRSQLVRERRRLRCEDDDSADNTNGLQVIKPQNSCCCFLTCTHLLVPALFPESCHSAT